MRQQCAIIPHPQPSSNIGAIETPTKCDHTSPFPFQHHCRYKGCTYGYLQKTVQNFTSTDTSFANRTFVSLHSPLVYARRELTGGV